MSSLQFRWKIRDHGQLAVRKSDEEGTGPELSGQNQGQAARCFSSFLYKEVERMVDFSTSQPAKNSQG